MAKDVYLESDSPKKAPGEDIHEPSRVLALSDGVVAIAITVLILPLADIEIPKQELVQNNLVSYIWENYSQLILSFLISWLVIINYWFDHHRAFNRLKYVDGFIIKANMLWLLAIVIMPFPTNLLAQDPNGPPGTAVAVYLVVLAVTSFALTLIEWHGQKHPELRDPARPWYTNSWIYGLVSTVYILILAVLAPLVGGGALWGMLGLFFIAGFMGQAGIGKTLENPDTVVSPLEEA